jgi:hypothetical protein
MIPKVETFENNIAQEIKRKEASLTEISSASNNVGNDPVELPKKAPVFFVALVIFFILCLLGFGMVIYFSMTTGGNISPTNTPPLVQTQATSSLETLSPTLSNQIGRFVTSVEKKKDGYIITINDYSSVFAYMTRNESEYIEELSLIFDGVPITIATTTPTSTQEIQQSTSTVPATTTATKATISSSTPLIETPPEKITLSESAPGVDASVASFNDITISNQNMRVWTRGDHTVIYSFVNNNIILISNTKEGILSLKSGILH